MESKSENSKILSFVFKLFILLVFFFPFISRKENIKTSKISINLPKKINNIKKLLPSPQSNSYSEQEIISWINNTRNDYTLAQLTNNDQLCQQTSNIFSDINSFTDSDLTAICPDCASGAYITFTNNFLPDNNFWDDDQEILDLITENYDHACVSLLENDGIVTLFKLPTITSTSTTITKEETVNPTNFTEDQLWQALVDYRHAHKKPDLLRSDRLCRYARERVEEHLNLFNTLSVEEYPSQDKYPLDNHVGFQRDGESGHLFKVTEFKVVAENLAYWPTAQYPHQVIEWGWDTSTEGHREAQLSTDYSHVCLTGQDGFYVSVFGRN